jgi:hypothetical protein
MRRPAATARIAIITGNPEKLIWSNWINPVMMSQTPSKSILRFFGNLNLPDFAAIFIHYTG